MTIRWDNLSQCYEFNTGKIAGGIEPYGSYHGLCGLMHQDLQVNFVRHKKAFLNAEYYIRPRSERKMLSREISRKRKTTHELQNGTVLIHFPPESEYELEMNLFYYPHDDMIDMRMTIIPTKDIPGFDIFFASYVCEMLNETWVLLKKDDDTRELVKLDNRETLNSIFGIMRDKSMFDLLADDYGTTHVNVEKRVYDKPILISKDSSTGISLIFLCDPHLTRYLAGQYHGWDTAHDWAYGADLQKGSQMTANTRLICRVFKNTDIMFTEIDKLWNDFIE
ncbi:MAG: hypothetical protein PHV82_00140 [Victivallaceae bacterium]|nr:hypothetical protein [Victivallaceae bacterium]